MPSNDELPIRFDDYEIHGVHQIATGIWEQTDDHEAELWSLFGHIPGQGSECIGDFESREQAEEVYARITGQAYGNRKPRNEEK